MEKRPDLRTLTPFREGLNLELFEEVLQHIEAEPRRLRMDKWLEIGKVSSKTGPPCGTVGCLAGWTYFIASMKDEAVLSDDIPETAERALGLYEREADRLFYVTLWPYGFRGVYGLASSKEEEVQLLTERVIHFIRTGQ